MEKFIHGIIDIHNLIERKSTHCQSSRFNQNLVPVAYVERKEIVLYISLGDYDPNAYGWLIKSHCFLDSYHFQSPLSFIVIAIFIEKKREQFQGRPAQHKGNG